MEAKKQRKLNWNSDKVSIIQNKNDSQQNGNEILSIKEDNGYKTLTFANNKGAIKV